MQHRHLQYSQRILHHTIPGSDKHESKLIVYDHDDAIANDEDTNEDDYHYCSDSDHDHHF